MSSSELSSEDDTIQKKMSKTFSVAQRACLNGFYSNGMTGGGKQHASLINRAASDTQLTTDQVKVIFKAT